MSTNINALQAYGLQQGGIIKMAPLPIPALRDPGTQDFAQPVTIWRNIVNPAVPKLWIFAGTNAGNAIWQLLEVGGGSGVFSSLTVTPGPISLTGTTSINTSGSGVTTIGTGGTGAVNIGNATGNTAVTGTLTTSAGITATTGNITASTGSIIASTNIVAGVEAVALGDLGSGVASTTALTNVTATAAGGGTVTFAANGGANITQTGWLKMYVGTSIAYVPWFTTI